MSFTDEQVVRIARAYLGTPYSHCGRRRGAGVDCIGLVTGICDEIGYPYEDWKRPYPRLPDGKSFYSTLLRFTDPVATGHQRAGDIGVFWINRHTRYPQHVCVFTPLRSALGMAHCYSTVGKVVEHAFEETWRKRLVGVVRLRGIEWRLSP